MEGVTTRYGPWRGNRGCSGVAGLMGAQNKPDAPRYTLARWLTDERFDEDASTGFQKVEKANKPAKPKPGKAKPRAHPVPGIRNLDDYHEGGVNARRRPRRS